MKAIIALFSMLLAACLDPPQPKARDLCGDPPLLSGVATFLTVIQDQPYVCATADGDHQRALEVSQTRQWEQCMTEARTRERSLILVRRDLNMARAAIAPWGEHAALAPGWADYTRAQDAWNEAIAEIDSWTTGAREEQP